jgi:hypothetical protein
MQFRLLAGAAAAILSAGATAQPAGQTQQAPAGAASQASAAKAETAAVKKATAADIKTGVDVYDSKGGLVGKIESVTAKGAVVNTGATKAELTTSSFGRGQKGLVIGMSKGELDAAAKAKASSKE